ncbi:MAG: phospho-sugar mutase [Bacteriovoracaceae bacterium]|nr:phospho-sugar mutase [Bacteriovoracaceae bacterium]
MERRAIEQAKNWVSNTYFDEADRLEIKKLLESNNTEELVELFYKDLEFGTGGIRSILGLGTNRINKYNIRKASQALASTVLDANQSKSIAISYDSRKFSYEFAKEAASVFAGNGLEVYIYKRLNPVALLSFSLRHHKCQAGIMVTASHNPPEYNGYKVFWNDGAQVTPPNDQKIISTYNELQDFNTIRYKDFDQGVSENLIHWVGKDVEDLYHQAIKSAYINKELCETRGSELKIIYTPIHGTGYVPCTRALDDIGLKNYQVVEEQKLPDSNFPTVTSPNPENPEALKMAVDLMLESNADIVMGSDPDTDRLGVAVNCNGEVKYPNGNQIGILMLHYILTNLTEQGRLPKDAYFVKTIVTTNLQNKIATNFGVKGETTLTGFKWICGRMNEIEQQEPHRNFVFATEESFGYLNHEYIRDKDGISPLTLMAEMTLWYKTQGMDLYQGLDKIYEQFGFHNETLLNLNYYGKEGADKIVRIMDKFRHLTLKEVCGQKIIKIEDYNQEGTGLPKSNVLSYELESGSKFFMRPSGTEPKIKFYIMISENEGTLANKKSKAEKLTKKLLTFIKKEADQA